MIELLTVRTADNVELDGALYMPTVEMPAWRRPILGIHGLTWNFYRGPMRWLGPAFAADGHPCLSLNMRDHDLEQPKEFELSHYDLRAGIEYLVERFGRHPIVVGHGYACNKVASYAAQSDDDRIRCNVLTTLGSVKKYRPDIWDSVLQSARRMQGDALVVQGAIDELIEPKARADDFVAAAQGCRVEVVHLGGGNHYFHGKEAELAREIVLWIAMTEKRGDRP